MTLTQRINELVETIADAINRRTQVVGAITLFGAPAAPAGWLMCHGQVLTIAAYPALAAVVGITYGGDGVSTFALPDLRDRLPLGASAFTPLGTTGGNGTVSIGIQHLPAHNHPATTTVNVSTGAGGVYPAPNASLCQAAAGTAAAAIYTTAPSGTVPLGGVSTAVESVGGGESLDIIPPFAALNYIIYAGA
jgi:microcystin-dependent protein